MEGMGKILIFIGAVLILSGLFFLLFSRIPFFGKLPGDIRIERHNFVFYFPIATSLLISLILSLILSLIFRR